MASVGFPDLKTHKNIHAKLLQDFSAHKARFDAGDGKVERAFFDFLSLWLRSHICHVDMRYNPRAARKAG
jgi:hemerythrin-like metal-binding protein